MGSVNSVENESYHIPGNGNLYELNSYADEQVEKWANDPKCIERNRCAEFLVKRRTLRAERDEQRAAKRLELQANPFDPRTEISADARHIGNKIVLNLWILFVLLPIAASILYSILK